MTLLRIVVTIGIGLLLPVVSGKIVDAVHAGDDRGARLFALLMTWVCYATGLLVGVLVFAPSTP